MALSKDALQVGDTPDFIAILKDQDGAYINISGATTLEFHLKKPNGTKVTKTASRLTTYSGPNQAIVEAVQNSAVMHYQAVTTDLDVQGDWAIEGYIVIGAGRWTTSFVAFTVNPVL